MPRATGNNSTAKAVWGEARLRRTGRTQEEFPIQPTVQELPMEVESNTLEENIVFQTNDEEVESEIGSIRSDGEISEDPEPIPSLVSSKSSSSKPLLADKLQQSYIELQTT